MPVSIEVRVQGLEVLLERMRRADARATAALRRAVRRGLEHLRRKVSPYPGQVSKPMQYASFRQMVYVLGAIRRGEIEVPYQRTGTLGRRWAIKVTTTETDVAGALGNVTPYGPFVQDLVQQSSYHRGNWDTVQNVVETERGAVVGFFQDEIRGLFD